MRLLRQALRDTRRSTIGFSIGALVFALIVIASYPSIHASAAQYEEIAKSFPEAMRSLFGGLDKLGTGPGFVEAEIFGASFPILMLVLAIGRGADAIAGDEERGALEATLALPIARSRVLLERAGAMALAIGAVVAVEAIVLLAGDAALDMGIPAANLLVACLGLYMLALAYGAIALLLGAATGRRGLAIGATAALAAASFLGNGLASLSDELTWLRTLSLHHQFDRAVPLTRNGEPIGIVVLLLVAAACVAASVWAFERRDVGVA